MVTYRRFEQFKTTIESLMPTLPRGSSFAIVYNTEGKTPDDERYYKYFVQIVKMGYQAGVDVNILDTGGNEGWGDSMNEGLHLYQQWKEFEYVLETNNDVTYEPNWCAQAQTLMETYAPIGILGLWSHPYHGLREQRPDIIIKDDMPATAWFMRSKDLETFLPFPEHGACKTNGGNGEDVGFRDKVQNKLHRWIAAPVKDLAHHIDGYNIPNLGKVNPEYE